jgi:hypothetical protein
MKLHHSSKLGEFWLASDAITNSYRRWTRPARFAEVLANVPGSEVAELYAAGCTVGAYMVWPLATHTDGRRPRSINQARGTNPKIRDRIDLTLECIRRHYIGEDSPLAPTMNHYRNFFSVLASFSGFIDHFLLQDLTEGSRIRFFTEFDDFRRDPLPTDVAAYLAYKRNAMDFIRARNRRIETLSRTPT